MHTNPLVSHIRRLQRSDGQYALKAASSITGLRLRQRRHALISPQLFSFPRLSRNISYQGIVALASAPAFLQSLDIAGTRTYRAATERLWNEAEAADGHPHAVTATSWVLQLPEELSPEKAHQVVLLFSRNADLLENRVAAQAESDEARFMSLLSDDGCRLGSQSTEAACFLRRLDLVIEQSR